MNEATEQQIAPWNASEVATSWRDHIAVTGDWESKPRATGSVLPRGLRRCLAKNIWEKMPLIAFAAKKIFIPSSISEAKDQLGVTKLSQINLWEEVSVAGQY